MFFFNFLLLSNCWISQSTAHKNELIPYLNHEQALSISRKLNLGQMIVLSPSTKKNLTAAGYETFKFKYIVGKTPIEKGGYFRLSMRHVFHWSIPQIKKPKAAGFVSISGPKGVTLEIVPWLGRADAFDLFLVNFPWQHVIEIRVIEGELNSGDEVFLTYGDQSQGGLGTQIQPTHAKRYSFRTYVAPQKGSTPLPLIDDINYQIVGGLTNHLNVVASSTVSKREQIKLTIRAEDKFGNLAPNYNGTIKISSEVGDLIETIKLKPENGGVISIRIPPPKKSGIFRFRITDDHFTTRSNPVAIGNTVYATNIYFGDLHGHSKESDGHGSPKEFYEYCRDVAALDICVLTDHGFMISDKAWSEIVKVTDQFYEPGKFVTFRAYEWSGLSDVGGDHNVYFRSTRSLIYRSRSYYDYRNQQTYHGPKPQLNFIEDLYSALRKDFKKGEVLTIPHYGGRAANSKWHAPQLEPLIEIFSEHQRSHKWAYDFIQRGYHLGFIGSSDNHTGRPGYGFLHNPLLKKRPVEIGSALAAVLADNLTRDDVFDSLLKRQVYATTGDRILLSFKADNVHMGDKIYKTTSPIFTLHAEGTEPIKKIEIYKNGKIVHTTNGTKVSASLTWIDRTLLKRNGRAVYWARVIQENNEEAIASPIIWFNQLK